MKIFKKLSDESDNVVFFVLGKVPDKYRSTDRIEFVGYVEEPMLRRYLRTADEMYYMAKYDWCPNAVVEAIVAGVKVHFNDECEVAKEFEAARPEDFYIDTIAKKYKKAFKEALCIDQ